MVRISASLSTMNCLSKLCPFNSAMLIVWSPMVILSPVWIVCEIPSSSEPSCQILKVSLNPELISSLNSCTNFSTSTDSNTLVSPLKYPTLPVEFVTS